jgi:hypothetical protein
MTTKTVIAVLFVAFALEGCSVIFDMNDYEPRSGAGASSSGGSSGLLADGAAADGNGGGTATDAATDRAPAECTREQEPNNDFFAANQLVVGQNCGMLSDEIDVDFFVFTATTDVTMELSIPGSVRFELFEEGSGIPTQTYSGGGGTSSVSAGRYAVRMSRVVGPTVPAAYEIVRN